MAVFSTNRFTLFPAPRLGLGVALARLRAAYVAWREERETHAALKSLSARELDDIGLTRGDIERISRTAPRF